MVFIKVLTFLVLIHRIYCSEISHPGLSENIDLTFFSITIWISCIIRFILIRFHVPIPCEFFVLMLGGAWGIFAYYHEVAALASQLSYVHPHHLIYIYFPILIFWMTFSIDVPIFIKTLPQIAVIGVLVAMLTSFIYGCIMRLIIDPAWSLYTALLFGLFTCPIYPGNIVYLLKRQTANTKQISVLLEGESTLTLIIAETTHTLLFYHKMGYIIKPEHFIGFLCRCFIFDFLTGFLFGLGARFLIRKMYTRRLCVFILVFGIPFMTYALCKTYLSGGGGIAVALVGAMMSQERAALSKDIDNFLTDYWQSIAFAMELVISATLGINFTSIVAHGKDASDYIIALVTYLMYYLVRFVSFSIFSPVLSRLGYGMDLRNMLVCVWSGIKNPFCLLLVRVYLIEDVGNRKRAQSFYFHLMILYVLSLFVNVSLMRKILDFLGLSQISLARQINMNNCMKHIFKKRCRIIAILKMNRFLGDAYWSKVLEATNMKHPYHFHLEVNDEDESFLNSHFTYCPDCNKEIPNELTSREFKEMKKEAKMRVLKAKKMSYSRQFENGMISKEAIRILTQTVELAMDSEENLIGMEVLQRKFTEEGCFTRFVRNRVHELNKSKRSSTNPPRKYFRRLCYYVVVNQTWERVMMLIISFHIFILILNLWYHPTFWGKKIPTYDFTKPHDVIITVTLLCFVNIYLIELVMKILAYSVFSIWNDGIRTYFKTFWNNIDFCVIIICYIKIIYIIRDLSAKWTAGSNIIEFCQILDGLQLLRIVRLFRLFEMFYPNLMRFLDRNADSKLALTYELGKSYAIGEAEILGMLPYMIDNKRIKEEIRKKIEYDRVLVTKLLGIVQKEKPWIAIMVKSKQAIRTILRSMNDTIKDVKNSGWADSYELGKLKYGLEQLYKQVNAIKTIQPSAPKIIFREISWMGHEETVVNFLFENIVIKKFEPDDIVFEKNRVADGIYIVVTGLFVITYNPDTEVLNKLHEYGHLPIVDYLPGIKYEEEATDFIVSGNCIGELSTLTGRSYNCVVTADAHCQVYILQTDILKQAVGLSPDPVTGLECRIWKEVSVRIALPLLLTVPAYQSLSQDQIKYKLERAFVPNLSNFKVFTITDTIQDIILIEGIAFDYNTRETFIAPYYIPRMVQKLILPKSSLVNVIVDIKTKLLIIPEKDVDEYDVMIAAAETCELYLLQQNVSNTLSRTVQDNVSTLREKLGKVKVDEIKLDL